MKCSHPKTPHGLCNYFDCRRFIPIANFKDFKHICRFNEQAFETDVGCERCGTLVEAGLQYSPKDDKELYLCKACFEKEYREAVTESVIIDKKVNP